MSLSQQEPTQNNHIPALLSNPTESLHQMLGAAPVAIIAVNQTGNILYVNKRLEELFGYEYSELLNKKIEMLLPERLRARHSQQRADYMVAPYLRSMGSGMNLVGQRKDGSEFPLEAGLSTVLANNEQVVDEQVVDQQVVDQQIVIASIVDITARRQLEETLEQRVAERTAELERRRRVADGLRDVLAVANQNYQLPEILDYIVGQACMLLDADACAIFQANQSKKIAEIQSHYGLSTTYLEQTPIVLNDETLIGRSIIDCQWEVASDTIINAEETDTKMPTNVSAAPGQQLFKDGYDALISIPLVLQREIYGALVLYYKTEREFSQGEVDLAIMFGDQAGLVIENARLRVYAEEAAVAAERSRIARDLHDSVTQTLFSATIITEVLPRIWERDVEQGEQRLSELHRLNRQALAEMNTMLLELRPAMLDDADLNEVLQNLVDTTINRAHHAVTLQVDGTPQQLPNKVRIALYRITQEALNNVSKHASATNATVVLRASSQAASLSITDDGVGFNIEEIDGTREGLTIMNERADEIDALLEFMTAPGNGTKVAVLWQNSE